MDKAAFALLTGDFNLSPAQMDTLAQAIASYDFGTDSVGITWRDQMVAALRNGDLAEAKNRRGAIVAGNPAVHSCG
jgi:hypothetical protein